MTELPKEWQQEAEKTTEDTYMYLQGATAYKQAVEKLLKDNLAQINKDLKTTLEREDILCLSGEKTAVEILLTELQTLKPISND